MMILEPPQMPRIEGKADWAEASCLFGEGSSVFREDLIEALRQTGRFKKPGLILDDIWRELTWRSNEIPEYYPFELQNDRISRRNTWQSLFCYSFMLFFSTDAFYLSSEERQVSHKASSKLFERLTAFCLEKYIPRSVVFGFPRQGKVPKKINEALEFIREASHETFRENPIPKMPRILFGDAGCDIFAWSPLDFRSGQIILLVQCTVQDNWYEHSLQNIPKLNYWAEKIFDFSVTTPNNAAAIPYVCHTGWHDYSKLFGLMLDRLRLASLFMQRSQRLRSKRLTNQIIDYCQGRVQSIEPKWLQ